MTGKKFNFNIRVNPELNRYTNQVLFPEQVASAAAFLAEAGLPEAATGADSLAVAEQKSSHQKDTSLHYFINHLSLTKHQTTDAIRHFPTDELLNEFLYVVKKKPDEEVRIILLLLLTQQPTPHWSNSGFQQAFSLAETAYDKPDSNMAWPVGQADDPHHNSLAWVIRLLPAFPLEAIRSIDAYLLANWAALPATYAEALNECEAIIRTKYLGQASPHQVLANLGARDFELLVASLYEWLGYHAENPAYGPEEQFYNQNVSYKSPDGQLVLIQCKNSDRAVGIAETKRFMATIKATKSGRGILVTDSRFSAEARKFAFNRQALELIDGEHLVSLFNRHLGDYWLSKVDKYISKQKLKQLQRLY